jgi:flagellar motility protein MotE (MotC chaperone)
MSAMSIEEQIKNIAKEEIRRQLAEIEEGFREYLEKEIGEIREQLSGLSSRTEKLEKRLDERMNLLVKLRKYTLDQLMSEYNRLMDIMRPAEKKETAENVEV